MIRTELRKWDFIDNDKEWKEWKDGLSKRDSSNYSKFMSYRSHLVKTERRIDQLNEQLKMEKDKVRDYLSKLTDINGRIDHLRKDFNLSISVSSWTKDNKNWYCLGTISRSGFNKISFNLGNFENKVRPRLMEYYKTNHPKKKLFNSQDLDTYDGRSNFCEKLNMVLFSYHPQIRKHIRNNLKIKSLKESLDFFFPIRPKGKPKSKGVSIPIMITNQMRMDLLTLGWTRDEMKELTPKECWEIINKGVPKKPSRERGRNQ